MSLPTSPGRARLTERLVVDLGAAFQQRAVYAADHPQVQRAYERAIAAFAAWCDQESTSELSLLTLEGQLLVDRQAIPDDSPWARGLLQTFSRYEIRGLTLIAGLGAAELGTFCDACQATKKASSTPHILVGQVGFAAGEAVDGATSVGVPGHGAPKWLSTEQREEACAELVGVASGATTRIDRLRALILRLTSTAELGGLELLRLEPAGTADRAFLHGLAVALATLRLGRALGLAGETLDGLALAGLLHDIGFLEAGPPGEDSDERRARHPIRGAARLAAVDGLPDLVALVAYEHHLRFDRAPNYPPMVAPRAPIAAARLVAVADTWETLRGRGGLSEGEALAVLRGRAGTYLDPALVEVFVALLSP